MSVTFAHWGHYTPCFKNLFENLGYEVISPEKTTQRDIRRGTKLSPELYCFPLKVNVGNYLTPLEKGADTIFMWESVHGNCRFRYYWIVQQKVLREAGYDVRVINLNGKNFLSKMRGIKKENDLSWREVVHAITLCLEQIRFVEGLEEKAAHFRPREVDEGKTDQLFEEVFEEMPAVKTFKELRKLKRKAKSGFDKIQLKDNEDVLKTKLIGEIYTVVDNAINFDLEKKLGKMGVEVERDMSISYFVKHGLFPWLNYFVQKRVDPYLKSTVGGHGRDAVKEMLDSIKGNMDGVVHLLPFGCFVKDTNITVDGFLQKPIQDIEEGEKVLTHNGRFKRVTQTFCRDYQGSLFEVDCGGKLNLKLTPEHPVLLAKAFTKNHSKKFNDLEFTPIREAEEGDFIAMLKISSAGAIKRMDDETIKVTDRENNVRFRELDNYFLVPIREIEEVNFEGKVYNLEVEQDHSYTANFLAVHNCMPEVTVRPILQDLHQKSGLPFLSLSLDEEVGEAGIQTRLEAFVDVLKNYHQDQKT